MSRTGKYTKYLHGSGFRADLEGLRPRPGETWIRDEDGMQVDEDAKRVAIEVRCPSCSRYLGAFYRYTTDGVFGNNPRDTQFDNRLASSVQRDGRKWHLGCRSCPTADEQCSEAVIDTALERMVDQVGEGGRMTVRLDQIRGRSQPRG